MALKPAICTVQEDNDRIRITQWHLSPATQTGAHVHGYDYVVVPMTDGTLTILDDNGDPTDAHLKQGVSYYRQAGVSHNVTNQSSSDIVFVEIEIK